MNVSAPNMRRSFEVLQLLYQSHCWCAWESEIQRHRAHLMREALKPNQRQSEAIRGNQRQSEAIRGNQR